MFKTVALLEKNENVAPKIPQLFDDEDTTPPPLTPSSPPNQTQLKRNLDTSCMENIGGYILLGSVQCN